MEEILAAIKNAEGNDLKAFKNALGISESDTSPAGASAEERKQQYESLQKQYELTAQYGKMKEAQYEAERQNLIAQAEAYAATADLAEDAKKNAIELIEALKDGEEISIGRFDIPELDEALGKVAKLGEIQEKVRKAEADGRGEAARSQAKMISGMIGLENYSSSAIGKTTALFAQLADGSDEAQGQAAILGRSLAEAFSPQAIGLTVFNKIFSESMKVLTAFDNALANVVGKTGTVGKFNDNLYDAQRAGNLLGVSMSDAANSIVALNAGTSQFAKLNSQTRTDLVITSSQFEKLGVSATDTAAFMENAFKIMNMGASEAVQAQKELAMAGVELGIGADKIVKDFNQASKVLAVYGKNSIGIFKDLAAQAKAAGVEVGTLLNIVGKFDTFAGAAEGSAKFNALLGTQLSTTQMLMMTEDERMKTLVESVQAQGVAFGDMDRFTQKAIAAAAGITDMNEANRIFSMSLADYEANAAQMEQNAEAQQKFDDAVQATVPTMNKFKNLATELIVMVQPALEKLGEVADFLTDAFQSMDKETKEVIGTVALFAAGIMAIAPMFAIGSGFMAGIAAIGPAFAAMGTGIGTGLGAISTAVAASGGIAGAVILALLAGGGMIAATMVAMAESEAAVAKANAEMMEKGGDTIQAIADIGNADFSGIATKFKGVVEELNSMGTDVKVTSTLQNLALMSAGTAFDLTGAKIAASSTNVTANVKNVFDGMKMTLEAGGKEFEAYVKTVAAETVLT